MAEAIAIRQTLTRLGIAHPGTVDYLIDGAGSGAGINSVAVITMMSKTNIEDVFKQLRAASTDPTVAAANRPQAYVGTKLAIEMLVMSVQILSCRGYAADLEVIQTLNSDHAVRFFRLVRQHRRGESDKGPSKDGVIELPVLSANTKPNSPYVRDWMDNCISVLSQHTSKDGFTPLSYVLRVDDNAVTYASLPAGDTFKTKAAAAARLSGTDFDVDKQTVYVALVEACAKCGKSYVDRHLDDQDGRAAWQGVTGYGS